MCFHLLIPQRIAHLQPGGGEGGADAGGGGEEEGEAEGGRDHAGREGEIQGEEDRAKSPDSPEIGDPGGDGGI